MLKTKRILSMLLAVLMLLGLMPMGIFADDTGRNLLDTTLTDPDGPMGIYP